MPLKISLSWPAWSGKSSLINAIVEKYGMETADVGQIFRQRALEKSLTIAEYDKLVEMNPQEDVEIDKALKEIVQHCPHDIIVSWRVGFHFLPDIVSIRLDVDPQEWAQRIFLDDRWAQEKKYASVEDALKSNADRMSRAKNRLLKLYGVDFTDTSHYTKIIDTTGKTFEENFEALDEFIQSL